MQFKIIAGFSGLAVLLILFACPEHTYNRAAVYETDVTSDDNLPATSSEAIDSEKNDAIVEEADRTETGTPNSSTKVGTNETKKTFLQELRPFNGRFSNDNFFQLIARPFVCFCYPATIWAFLLQGTFVSWGIGVAIVLSQIFAPPPIHFSATKIGYIFAFPFVGGLLAYIFGAVLVDSSAKWAARRNNRIFEPEFRIFLVLPVFLVGVPAFFGYGHYAMVAHPSWVVVSLLYGMITFAVVLTVTATYSYVLDAHRDISVEMMVSILLLKNFFAFGASTFLPDWIDADKPAKTFDAIGGMEIAICLTSLIMYFYGKVFREFYHRKSPLKACGLI
jgi:hypothetical protein